MKHLLKNQLAYTSKSRQRSLYMSVNSNPGEPPVSTTLVANFATIFASVVDTGGKFAAGVNDTGGEFATGVVDTGGNFG